MDPASMSSAVPPAFAVRLPEIDSDTLAIFARYDVRITVKRRAVTRVADEGRELDAAQTLSADVPGREFAPFLADLMNAETALLVSLGADTADGGVRMEIIGRGSEADLAFVALRRLHGSRMDVVEAPAGVGD